MTSAERPRIPLGWLWFGFLGPPIIWAIRFMIAYVLVPAACEPRGLLALNIVTVVALGGTIIAGVVAAVVLRRSQDGEPADPIRRRTRFMAMVGLMSSALFTTVIVAEGLGNVLVDPCLGAGVPL